ncbi:MAG: Na+/H+ antiporter NhaC family protein [Peptoniphilus sp.]|uniref:YfcC family protein n=1 Tax=Peptoniphilus sp. TaxID=1971214 RepID=UPI002A758D3B|nr:Na+/H+ antiporter NhaC family protein [Peptoniphilus sp.]MDY2986315.1 Na+/H+ antiporter NhaC family protein [Peptoniphilus sp.]
METKKKKMPHTLVILMGIIIFAVILTWVIPSAEYTRVENAQGVKVIDPNTFNYIEKTPVNPLKVFNLAIEGFEKSAVLITVILFSGAAFNVITKSGALQSLIGMVSRKTKSKEYLFIPILTLIFGLICTTQGVNTFIGFAPIMVMIAIALGFDSIVGAAILLLGGAVGFSTGTLNVNTTIVAQEIAGLAPYSGIGFRAVCFAVFYIVTNFMLIKYAMKIKKNPELSPMYELDKDRSYEKEGNDEFNKPMNTQKWLIISSLFLALGIIVYGGVKLKWKLDETAAVFIWLSIVAGIIAGYSPSTIAKYFVEGCKNMIGAALIIGFARTVSGVLSAGNIMDTSIHAMTQGINIFPQILKAPIMFIVNLIVNIFITSGSGQAAAIMPIFAPLADTVGISRQTAVLAFNFGDGFCNYILPTSTALMGVLGATDIPYDKWMIFMGKIFGVWIVIGSVLMIAAEIIGYM